jgi:hypothetical protein
VGRYLKAKRNLTEGLNMATPSNDLNISQAGYVVFDGTSTFTGRTFQAGTGIALTNASGVAGNTTISVTGGAPVTSVTTSNATPQFVLSGSTENVDFGISNLLLGSAGSSIIGGASSNTSLGLSAMAALTNGENNCAVGTDALTLMNTGIQNTACGSNALASITNGQSCTAVGYAALNKCTTNSNTAIGAGCLQSVVTGNQNVGVGYTCLANATNSSNSVVGHNGLDNLTTGNQNSGIGAELAVGLLTGSNNIFMGYTAGSSYTGAESGNILINSAGTVGESNVTRIGTNQTQCYLAGVLNTVSGRVVKVTTPGAYPYTSLITDDVIIVDTSSARTINLIASPVTGTTYRIKDVTGSAATNNITVTPNAGNIDGAGTYVMNLNYESIDICYTGSQWSIL